MDTKKLRQKILDLAIHGKLVPQDPNDEPASVLLERIRAEKEALIKEGKIKRAKKTTASDTSHYENMPFDVPEGWCWTTIGDVSSSILYGVSESAKEVGTFKLLRITDIQDNKVDWNTVPYTDFDKDKALKYLLQDGDILFARTGATVGKSYLVSNLSEESIYASYLIRVQTSHLILPEYIKRFFESGYYWEQISLSSVGIGQPNVNGTTLANLKIPIPPFKEQVRIVEEANSWLSFANNLDDNTGHIGKVIESTKAKILDLAIHGKLVPQDPTDEPASELLKRINPKAIITGDNPHYEQVPFEIPSNWSWATLGDITNYGKCSTVPVDDIDEESWVLELEDIEKDSAKVIKLCTKSDRAIKGVRHSFLQGYVLYSKLRTYLNKVLVANKDGFCTTEIIPIKCSNSIYPEYLCHVLRSKYFLDYTAQCGYGVKMPRLSTTDARKALVPLPPYEEQIKISAIIKELYCSLDSIAETLA